MFGIIKDDVANLLSRHHRGYPWTRMPSAICILLCCIALPLMEINYSIAQSTLLIVSCIALLIVNVYPYVGSWMILLCWVIGIFPGTETILPNGYFIACMLAVGVLGYCNIEQGIAGTIVIGIISFMTRVISDSLNAFEMDLVVGTSRTLPNMLFLYLLFPVSALLLSMLVGYVMRQEQDKALMRQRLRECRTRDAVTEKLHDHIANDITDAVLILRHHMQISPSDNAQLSNALQSMMQANIGVRQLINQLNEGTADGFDLNDEKRLPQSVLPDRLRQIGDRQRQRLTAMGFNGSILLPDTSDHEDTPEVVALLTGLMRESLGNIASHADPRFDYVFSIETLPCQYVMRVTDVPLKRMSDDMHHMHSGLGRYGERLHRYGGSMRVSQDAGRWSMEAVIKR